jgi:hypothetical protein
MLPSLQRALFCHDSARLPEVMPVYVHGPVGHAHCAAGGCGAVPQLHVGVPTTPEAEQVSEPEQ